MSMEYIYSCHGCAVVFSATAEVEVCSHCECGFIELTLVQEQHSDDDVEDNMEGAQLASEPANYVTSQSMYDRVVDELFQQATAAYLNDTRASETNVDDLPEVEIDQSHLDQELKCIICQEEYELQTRTLQLPCSHLFHKNCLQQWFERHSGCPLCRSKADHEDTDGGDGADVSHGEDESCSGSSGDENCGTPV